MGYAVSLTARAEDDAYAAFEYVREHSPDAAEGWLAGLFESIFSLSDMPRRCPEVPESNALGREVRHLLYGARSAAYRIVFDIVDESTTEPRVRVLRVWRGSRDRLRLEDLAPGAT